MEWSDLFISIAKRHCVDDDVIRLLSSGELLRMDNERVGHIKCYLAADMKSVMDTAYLEAIHFHLAEAPNTPQQSSEGMPVQVQTHPNLSVCKEDLMNALTSTRPSLLSSDGQVPRQIYEPFYCQESSKGKVINEKFPPLGGFDDQSANGDLANDLSNTFTSHTLGEKQLRTDLIGSPSTNAFHNR